MDDDVEIGNPYAAIMVDANENDYSYVYTNKVADEYIPKVDQIFESLQEVYDFYNNYANSVDLVSLSTITQIPSCPSRVRWRVPGASQSVLGRVVLLEFKRSAADQLLGRAWDDAQDVFGAVGLRTLAGDDYNGSGKRKFGYLFLGCP
ncbi:hypothetical protein ACLB2K_003815 [Fragaria x ananassa]